MENPVLNVLICGSTEISKIPGITAAGRDPEATFETPSLDAEIMVEGRIIKGREIPITPDGIPTPSIVSKACLDLLGIPTLVVNGGLQRKPNCYYIETGLSPALSGDTKIALPQMAEAINFGTKLSEMLRNINKPIMISESVPGGTTTAQLTMRLWGKTFNSSSSMISNPGTLKDEIVSKALQLHGIQSDPLKSIKCGGDYMQALLLGILSNQDGKTIYLCGGTQMAVVWYIAKEIGINVDNVFLVTTDLVMKGSFNEITKIVKGENILVAETNFQNSKYHGLNEYSQGVAKEGAGMGGSLFFAQRTKSPDEVINAIERFYSRFLP